MNNLGFSECPCCYGDGTKEEEEEEGRGLKTALRTAGQTDGGRCKQASSQIPGRFFAMYIKFCRRYGEDKKDEASENLSSESKLSVELEAGKDKPTEGNTRLYRGVCVFLAIICLLLLLAVISLSVKLQNGSTVCPERKQTTTPGSQSPALPAVCSHEECQTLFPSIQRQHLGCKQCADDWLTFGRSCFYLSTSRLSWDKSQRNCTARGGALAVVTSQKVQDFLTKKGILKYWIGLRQRGATWTWINNTVLQKSHWADVASEGDCGILDSEAPPEKNWIRASCEAYTYYICQLQL